MAESNTVCDTNILLDHLLGRSPILKNLLEKHISVTIPLPIWLESVYVLETVFKQEPSMITKTLIRILTTQGITAPQKTITSMLDLYQTKPFTSIIDCYLIYFATHQQLTLTSRDKKLMTKFNHYQIKSP